MNLRFVNPSSSAWVGPLPYELDGSARARAGADVWLPDGSDQSLPRAGSAYPQWSVPYGNRRLTRLPHIRARSQNGPPACKLLALTPFTRDT